MPADPGRVDVLSLLGFGSGAFGALHVGSRPAGEHSMSVFHLTGEVGCRLCIVVRGAARTRMAACCGTSGVVG